MSGAERNAICRFYLEHLKAGGLVPPLVCKCAVRNSQVRPENAGVNDTAAICLWIKCNSASEKSCNLVFKFSIKR